MNSLRAIIGSGFILVGVPAALLGAYVQPGVPHLRLIFGFACFAALGAYLLWPLRRELGRYWPVFLGYALAWLAVIGLVWWGAVT